LDDPHLLPLEGDPGVEAHVLGLEGATARPRFLRILQRAATMVLFPEWEVVRGTTMNRVMSFAAGMSEFICLLE